MSIYATGLFISILIYLAVGNYAGRKVKHLEDYFVAGCQALTLLIVGTLVASLMSTNAFMGEAGLAVVVCGLLAYWGASRSFTRNSEHENEF